MRKWKRTLFFWILVLLFLITAPLIILHAKGYRFDTQRGVFVYSGAITFKSNPQAVKISLNGKVTNSTRISILNNVYSAVGLLPQKYSIKIFAPGFDTWSKRVNVHSGLSTEFWNILLVRKKYQQFNNNTPKISKFFFSPKNNFLAYTQNSNQGFLTKILKITNQTTVSSLNFIGWKLASNSKQENIEWSPNELFISLPVQKKTIFSNKYSEKPHYAYLIANLANKTFFNLNKFVKKRSLEKIRWDPVNKNYLFFLSRKKLYRVNITKPASLTKIASNISSYDISQTGVYYVQRPNNLVFKINLDGKSTPIQITNYFPDSNNIFISNLIAYDNSRIVLLSKNRNLYIYNQGEHRTYFKKLGQKIRSVSFSNDGKKLLFWSQNEILVYFLHDWKVQPIRQENELENITRYSEKIKNVQWFKDYEHIIFSVGNTIKIIELDPRDHKNCMDIIKSNSKNPLVTYNGFLEKLYFTNLQDNDQATLTSIAFPEKIPFLGIASL